MPDTVKSLDESSEVVVAYTQGQDHPSAAHIVGGFKYRITRTLFVVLGHMCLGIYVELAGPTLPDLRDQTNTSYEEISQALVARSVGYMLSAISFGILTDRFQHHVELLLATSFILGTVSTILVPWGSELWQLALIFHLQGWAMGSADMCQNFLILRLWGKDSAPAMYALHVGFGVGALIAPQLARQYISNHHSTNSTSTPPYTSNPENYSFHEYSLTNSSDESSEARLQIPYTISALICFILVIIYIATFIYENIKLSKMSGKPMMIYEKSKSQLKSQIYKYKEMFSPGSCTGGRTTFGYVFFTLLFLYFLNLVGGERAYGKFLYSFAIDGPLDFSKDEAADLNSVWWFCFMAGRASGIIYSKWLPAFVTIYIFATLQIIATTILTIWGTTVKPVVWAMTGVFGFSLAPLFPAAMSWSNLYVNMRGVAVSILIVGNSIGGMIYQWVTGAVFEQYGPQSLMSVVLIYAVVIAVIYIALFIVAKKQGQRFDVINIEDYCPDETSSSLQHSGIDKHGTGDEDF